MKSKKGFLIIVLVLVAVLIGAGILYSQLGGALEPNAGLQGQEGPAAPDFQVYDLDGNPVKLSQFLGKPIVLNFWASWCGPCQMEMPDFNEAYLELGDEVQFLMINCTDGSRETVESADAFIQSKDYSFPVYFDREGAAAYAYSAYALPTTYFIDANGIVVTKSVGAISAKTLRLGIDMIQNTTEGG